MWKNVNAVIFDLDGTLIDSMAVWEQIDTDFLSKRGIAVPSDYMQMIKVMDYAKAAHYTIDRFGFDESPQAIMDEWHTMAVDAYSHHIQLKPGVETLLRYLKGKGLAIGLATASTKELYEPVLKNNGIYDLFDAFASTGEVDKGKGHPDIYWLCAQRLGAVPQECIVFEDVLAGIKGAKAAGMRAVGVYDAHSAYESEAMQALADDYVFAYDQLKLP